MKKVSWGVIGAGGIADRRTIPGIMLSENSTLYAVMEVSEERAKEIKEKYGAEKYYTDADEMLSDKNIDAVYIASPVQYHKEQIEKAVKAGKHILCEKPLCLTAKESKYVSDLLKSNKLMGATGFMMRYNSLNEKMKEIVQGGKIGELVSCRAQMNCWFPYIKGNWRQQKAVSGGGALIDMGIHCIDIIEFITGEKFEKAFGFCETKTFEYDIDDSSDSVLKLTGGATVYIDVNYNIPDDVCPCRLEFFGTKGSLIAEGTIGQEDTGTLKYVFSDQSDYSAQQQRKEAKTEFYSPKGVNLYEREITSFADSILNGTKIKVPMETAVTAQRVVETIYASSESGKAENIQNK